MSRVKTRAVVQARMLSSRLRGKSLMAVGGTPLLMRVIDRIRAMDFIDEIMIATTSDPADDPIEALVLKKHALVFRGDRADVLDRFNQATSDLDEDDCIIRFTADNPLYDAKPSRAAFQEHVKASADYTYIDGLSHVVPEFIRVGALRHAHNQTSEPFDREHVTPYLRRNYGEQFQTQRLNANFGGLRPEMDRYLTIDNQSQLETIEAMYEDIGNGQSQPALNAIYRWFDFRRAGLLDSAQVKATISDVDSAGFQISGRCIGEGYPAFIVAEIGQNHNGQLGMAKRLIDVAAESGCDAVKFQKRDIGWELTKEAYERVYDNPNSFGRTYGEHREFLELNEEQHAELREYSNARGLIYFCTACDPPSVDLMERIGNPVYKIASRDITNIPLLRHVSKTGKPIIISTGMAGMEEIREAITTINEHCDSILITHCVSQYPTEIKNVNLNAMETIAREFGYPIGLSDHTTGIITCVAGVAMGASLIEKHITLSRAMPGTDHGAALEEEGLRRMVRYIRTVELARGDGTKAFLPVVQQAKEKLARSLTSAESIRRGQVLTEDMLVLKSPGNGIPWSERGSIVGKRAIDDIPGDQTLDASQFES